MTASYSLFDVNGTAVSHKDLQDKGEWCISGLKKEDVFVNKYGKMLGISINPKKESDIYAPDLVDTYGEAELKTQNTPFFQSKERYGMDPQYTVTFNRKDYERYVEKYPNLTIYFWVDWVATKYVSQDGRIIEVMPMAGVWAISFKDLEKMCMDSPEHGYLQRKYDKQGNAKSSFLINLLRSGFTRLIG